MTLLDSISLFENAPLLPLHSEAAVKALFEVFERADTTTELQQKAVDICIKIYKNQQTPKDTKEQAYSCILKIFEKTDLTLSGIKDRVYAVLFEAEYSKLVQRFSNTFQKHYAFGKQERDVEPADLVMMAFAKFYDLIRGNTPINGHAMGYLVNITTGLFLNQIRKKTTHIGDKPLVKEKKVEDKKDDTTVEGNETNQPQKPSSRVKLGLVEKDAVTKEYEEDAIFNISVRNFSIDVENNPSHDNTTVGGEVYDLEGLIKYLEQVSPTCRMMFSFLLLGFDKSKSQVGEQNLYSYIAEVEENITDKTKKTKRIASLQEIMSKNCLPKWAAILTKLGYDVSTYFNKK
jgi:DNA-directed RNA polymerase specialized sigma24 family protein